MGCFCDTRPTFIFTTLEWGSPKDWCSRLHNVAINYAVVETQKKESEIHDAKCNKEHE